jgi:hypothetical protein
MHLSIGLAGVAEAMPERVVTVGWAAVEAVVHPQALLHWLEALL